MLRPSLLLIASLRNHTVPCVYHGTCPGGRPLSGYQGSSRHTMLRPCSAAVLAHGPTVTPTYGSTPSTSRWPVCRHAWIDTPTSGVDAFEAAFLLTVDENPVASVVGPSPLAPSTLRTYAPEQTPFLSRTLGCDLSMEFILY